MTIENELEDVREKDLVIFKIQFMLMVNMQCFNLHSRDGYCWKDSMIREVFKDFNTRGIVVHSFKVPTELELNHDYLWRHYIALPARGKFGVFNRTHYENVLVLVCILDIF